MGRLLTWLTLARAAEAAEWARLAESWAAIRSSRATCRLTLTPHFFLLLWKPSAPTWWRWESLEARLLDSLEAASCAEARCCRLELT